MALAKVNAIAGNCIGTSIILTRSIRVHVHKPIVVFIKIAVTMFLHLFDVRRVVRGFFIVNFGLFGSLLMAIQAIGSICKASFGVTGRCSCCCWWWWLVRLHSTEKLRNRIFKRKNTLPKERINTHRAGHRRFGLLLFNKIVCFVGGFEFFKNCTSKSFDLCLAFGPANEIQIKSNYFIIKSLKKNSIYQVLNTPTLRPLATA